MFVSLPIAESSSFPVTNKEPLPEMKRCDTHDPNVASSQVTVTPVAVPRIEITTDKSVCQHNDIPNNPTEIEETSMDMDAVVFSKERNTKQVGKFKIISESASITDSTSLIQPAILGFGPTKRKRSSSDAKDDGKKRGKITVFNRFSNTELQTDNTRVGNMSQIGTGKSDEGNVEVLAGTDKHGNALNMDEGLNHENIISAKQPCRES